MNKNNTLSTENREARPLSRSEQKHDAILQAAHTAFLENSYEAVSMDTIAEMAGVSKRTVYSHFGSKEDLFGGIMEAACTAKREVLLTCIEMDRSLEEVLADYGRAFLTQMFDREVIILLRILISRVDQLPGLGETFFESGPKESIALLGNYLRDQDSKGNIAVADPDEAAASFMSSLFGVSQMVALATNLPVPDEKRIEATVEGAVDRFLNGVIVR